MSICNQIEEIFEMVRDKLQAAGMEHAAGNRCVITGGASQMLGVGDMATKMLDKQVRKGNPAMLSGLADSVTGPAFSTAVGMLKHSLQRPWENEILQQGSERSSISRTSKKIARWFKENF